MERYRLDIKEEIFIRGLEVELTNMRHGKQEDRKTVYLYEDDLYSFIYINDKDKLGNNGEVIVRGRITSIEKVVIRNTTALHHDTYDSTTSSFSPTYGSKRTNAHSFDKRMYTINVDCSTKYGSNIIKLDLDKILDIGPIDNDWNMKDDSKLIPEIPELTTWIDKSKSPKNEDTYISKEYNRPHPSII